MAIKFTQAQQKVLDARNHNILVSAAAGSGKTAVLVERIVRLITEGDNPPDIDRLLVVTFTRAAAAQMRERIGAALSKRLREDPGNTHLQRQEVLLHNAQITTIDSFCTFLLRNYFSEIDLDPGFRQIEPAENSLIAAQVLEDYLEEKYQEKDPAFLHCVDYFCTGAQSDDKELEDLINELWKRAGSHPCPEAWIRERSRDYDVRSEEELFRQPWMKSLISRSVQLLLESESAYEAMQDLCLQPDGPDAVWPFLEEERRALFGQVLHILSGIKENEEREGFLQEAGGKERIEGKEGIDAIKETDGKGRIHGKDEINGVFSLPSDPAALRNLWETILKAVSWSFPTYPSMRGKKYAHYDKTLRDSVKGMRDREKKAVKNLADSIRGQSPAMILAMMESAAEPVKTLSSLTLEFSARLQEEKKLRHVIDFVDLEHFALQILAERKEDGSYVPRRVAKALRSHYAEILIDEYQDSNEVQEVLLQIISGEDEGRNNRFMVGDIKQSIYRFRQAKPEIFTEKYDTYRHDDPVTERIDLDQNFRSRAEVLDCVNDILMRIMRREVGGVDYDQSVSLKKGAVFPDENPDSCTGGISSELAFPKSSGVSPYKAEFWLLDTAEAGGEDEKVPSSQGNGSNTDGDSGDFYEGGGENDGLSEEEDSVSSLDGGISDLTDRQKEALLIASRIRQIVGILPVRDEETQELRPARYGDIVILLRSTVGWNEDLRAVFEREGIPSYTDSKNGYFAAEEIRSLLSMLKVLDNPRQDIPLYSALRGYFGDFTQDEIALVRQASDQGLLFDALKTAAGEGPAPAADSLISPYLSEKCASFLSFLREWRARMQYCSITEIVNGLLEETGFQDYCTALPAGAQRAANLRMLQTRADSFARTEFTGLFQFLRFIEKMKEKEIDYGEANTLDENADVVRIMTIHKSKGLEFPVCIAAGLSGTFSFRRKDTSAPVLYDGDWGLGINYFDVTSRVRSSTLRRTEIGEKIKRDSMGEELRVLYVAMTRAKEKLILTASQKGIKKKLKNWLSAMTGFYSRPGSFRLSPFMIGGASCYAELISKAVMAQAGQDYSSILFSGDPRMQADVPQGDILFSGGQLMQAQDSEGDGEKIRGLENIFPMDIRIVYAEDLQMQAAAEQLDLSQCDEILRGLEGHPLDSQPDPAAAQELASRYFRVYPHEELRDLYAQTSVSELKHKAMRSAYEQQEEGTSEGPAEMFPEEVPVPYLPAFLRRETESAGEEDGDGKVREAAAAAARRGTAFHRVLELLDYSRRETLLSVGREGIEEWLRSISGSGSIAAEDAALINIRQLQNFLSSSLAQRMEAADQAGLLFREQPFVMGCPADRVGEGLPKEETVMIQGIIDAFFIEDGKIVLVDYKTDRVENADELKMRYSTQLELYAEALCNAYEVPVRQKIIYSTVLGEEIRL